MKIRDLLEVAQKRLTETKIENPNLDSRVLLKHVLGVDESYIILHDEDVEIDNNTSIVYCQLVKMRSMNMPIAYITNHKEFMGIDFYVDENVLIPRCDSEALVEEAIKLCGDGFHILDLCCGSGCLGLSLAMNKKDIKVDMSDISVEALEIAKINTENLSLGQRVHLYGGNLFDAVPKREYDMILSNPPYVAYEEYKDLSKDIVEYEPELALVAAEDGMLFYKNIIHDAPSYLKEGGYILFEVGNKQSRKVMKLLKKEFVDIRTLKDLSGIERVVVARKK